MASRYPYDDDDYDDGVIYAEPQKYVRHPGMERHLGHGSSNTGNRDTGRRQPRDPNPDMSVLTGRVSKIKLDEKKSLYRCDLENTIEGVERTTGVDIAGNEIFLDNVDDVTVYNINGQCVKEIECNVIKCIWDVKVCDNLLYISDIGKNKKVVLIMDKNGNVKSRIGLPLQEVGYEDGPLGLAIDEITKDIYVTSYNTDTVYKCTRDSDHFKPFITSGLSEPCYLCVGPGHEVIVSNCKSDNVIKYNSKGILQWSYGGQGSLNGQLYGPLGICTDPYGNIYVADCCNNRVVQISSDGKFLLNVNFGEDFEEPQALAFRDNRLIITTGLQDEREEENKIFVVKCQFV